MAPLISLILLLAAFGSAATAVANGPLTNIYDRARVEFASACFYKPIEKEPDQVCFKLAPLVIQELKTNSPPDLANVITTLEQQEPAKSRLEPVVYCWSDTEVINGTAHARMGFLWPYPPMHPSRGELKLPIQGIRITLNSAGEPCIWEVLTDNTGGKLVYVAESIEAAALKQYGAALKGRKYAVERDLVERPDTVVPRVIDDGPVPMGPIVYLSARSREVSTLICRCMPAQCKQLPETRTYRLRPLSTLSNPELLKLRGACNPQPAFWPGESDAVPLEKNLRLPSQF